MDECVRLCPNCHATMSAHTVHGLRLDICDACGGVWFDAGEFGKISRLGSRVVDEVVANEPPNLTPSADCPDGQTCPVEGEGLSHYHFAGSSDVMLGGCPKCAGIFLSHENLVRLDARDRRLEQRDGDLNSSEAAAVGYLDSESAAATFRSQLAQYNWQQALTPVMFS